MNAGEVLRLNADCLLREWPRASGLPVGLGKRGMALACAGEAREGWVPVDYQDRVAWVAERYVEGGTTLSVTASPCHRSTGLSSPSH